MIVKCDQCQARFKIPDEKVTDKGVKVRCTKCQHTFRVRRQGGEAVNEPAAPAPASKAAGQTAPRAADPFAAFGAPQPVPPEQATRPISTGHGLGSGLFGAPNSAPLGGDDSDGDPFEQKTRVARVPTELFRDDPEPVTRPSLPSARAVAPSPLAAQHHPAPGDDAEDPFALPPARELTKPAQGPAARPAAAPARFDDPFALPPEPKGLGSRPGAPPAAPMQHDDPFALPPEPKGLGSKPGSRPGSSPQAAPASTGRDPFGRAAATAQGSARFADPFAADDSDLGGPSGLELDAGGKADPRAMFELPSRPSATPARPAAPAVDLADRPDTGSGPVAIGRLSRPTARPEEAGVPEPAPKPGAARRLSGWAVNLTVSAALLLLVAAIGHVYLNEGSFDLSGLTFERVKAMFTPQASALVVEDVSNGLYETRSGKPVFFVRGEVVNRGESAAKVRVRAEILDGKELLRGAEAFAGGVPSPEDLYAVSNAQTLQALSQKLHASAAELAPGQRAPFVITFYEYPPDLSRFRLRVTPQTGEPRAAR